MTQLISYLKEQQAFDVEAKEKTGELRKVDQLTKERSQQFRQVLTKDSHFAYHKKMLFNLPTKKTQSKGSKVAFERNKDPYVHRLITNQSTFGKHIWRQSREDQELSSETEPDEDYNFF
jgi:hypothetical protein